MTTSKWTYEKVATIASKYDSRSDFSKHARGPYNWTLRNNCTDAACAHMKPRFRWTFESVMTEANKYKTRNEFRNEATGAYWWAKRNGKMDDVYAHMEPVLTFWDYDSVMAEASQYDSREEFRCNSKGAACWASRNGVLNSVCNHMGMGGSPSDADTIYMWKTEGYHDVFKIGVTSERLGNSRMEAVARFGGLSIEWCVTRKTDDAFADEKNLLSFGSPFTFPTPFNGSTEFREYSPQDVDESLALMGGH